MARRKKKNPEIKSFLKFLIIGVFACVFLFVAGTRTMEFFTRAKIFHVHEVVKSPSLQFIQSRYLDQLEGRNIFSVDLGGIEQRVRSEYPDVDQLRIIRQLPDRILVTAEKREPWVVAAVGSRDVVLDVHGVVLSADAPARGSLPYITGLTDVSSAAQGKKLSGVKIRVALDLVDALRQNHYLKSMALQSVDVGSLSKIYLYVNGVEVIIDRFKIAEKIETLGLLLSDAGLPLEKVNYLDLRFKEPVINKK